MALDPIQAMLVRLLALTAASLLFGHLLRWARFPGGTPACLLAGAILAGVLMGPGVLGGVRPDMHRALTVGHHPEIEAELERIESEHRAELAVMREVGVSGIALDERIVQQREERAPAALRLEQARADHMLPTRLAIAALVALVAFFGLAFRPVALDRQIAQPEAVALAIALTMVFVALPFSVGMGLAFGTSRLEGVLVGLAAASGSLAAGLVWRPSPKLAPTTAPTTASTTAPMTAMTLGGRLWLVGLSVLVGGVLIVLLPIVLAQLAALVLKPQPNRLSVDWPVQWLLIAPICAHVAASIDPQQVIATTGGIVFIIALVVLAGAGHWLGIGLALKTTGYQPLGERSATRTSLHWCSAGVFTSVPLWLGMLLAVGEPEIPDAALAGLLLVSLWFELSYGTTARVLDRMDEVERELDEPIE